MKPVAVIRFRGGKPHFSATIVSINKPPIGEFEVFTHPMKQDKETEEDAERYRHLRMFLTTKDLSIILERRPETDEEGDDVDAYLDKSIKENYGLENNPEEN